MSERDIAGLLFTAEMYGVQLDQLAAVLGVSEVRARARRGRAGGSSGYAESARLGPGPPWVWLTRAGLAACGLPYRPAPPALARLAHLRAVTAVRLALESAPGYAAAGAYWRSERRLRARMGGRVRLREHLPDGEVHWPDGARPGAPRPVGPGWAGECWAIEAELTRRPCAGPRRSCTRSSPGPATTAARPAQARVPGAPPRHARVLYLCSAAARPTVAGPGRARRAGRPGRDPAAAAGCGDPRRPAGRRAAPRAARPPGRGSGGRGPG